VTVGRRTTRPARTASGCRARNALVAAGCLVGALALPACGAAGASGPVSLSYYNEPDSSSATGDAAAACSKASGGAYKINYIKLPSSADTQRQQLARRLAAHDSSIDLMGLDVTWEAEFSEAGWIVPWTGADKATIEATTLPGPLDTATWNGQLVAAPLSSNTELLWYRSDLVPNPPTTWDQMINDATALAKAGKPHYIEIQGAQYEGLTVWFNSLVSSAGGSILTPDSKAPALGPPALTAMQIMKRLATSPAADPSLSVQMEDDNRHAMEQGGAAFEINYPFVYASMLSDNPTIPGTKTPMKSVFKWTLYPGVTAGSTAKPTIGGIDLTVSSYSKHKALAFQAAMCLRDAANQEEAAVVGGLPPTLRSLYVTPSPEFISKYPFYKEILAQLTNASVRPKTPEYEAVSIYISNLLSPPASISPESNLKTLHSRIADALAQKGVIP
jgi:multiple sugar transport system substrate-binding protein